MGGVGLYPGYSVEVRQLHEITSGDIYYAAINRPVHLGMYIISGVASGLYFVTEARTRGPLWVWKILNDTNILKKQALEIWTIIIAEIFYQAKNETK